MGIAYHIYANGLPELRADKAIAKAPSRDGSSIYAPVNGKRTAERSGKCADNKPPPAHDQTILIIDMRSAIHFLFTHHIYHAPVPMNILL
jgi:hypothetical protein